MKDRRDKCVVSYWATDMIGVNESVEVGKSADLFIDEKQKPYRDATGIIIDYEVDSYGSRYAKVRGLVTNIKAVYIDEYANNDDGTYNYDIPNNKFHIIEIDYADGGLNDTRDCGDRNKFDVKKYIITLQNVVIDKYEDFKGETSHGRLIWVEPGDEKEELFWAGFGGLLGDTHGLRIYSGRKKKKIHFPTRLQKELSEWRKDYWEHVNAGYELWSLNDWRNINDIVRICIKSLSDTIKNQSYIIKDINKQLKTKYSKNEINNLLNLKANNNEVSEAFNNVYNSIEDRATISQINELKNEKISKNELIYYLEEKPSHKDIENLLKDKIDKRELDEFFNKFEIFKKEINDKIGNYALNEDLLGVKKNIEKKENDDILEIKNILEQKADKESVYSSLKLKSDKNEMNTILGNKLDKSDLAIIIKALNEKLNKEEFYKYKDLNENNNSNLINKNIQNNTNYKNVNKKNIQNNSNNNFSNNKYNTNTNSFNNTYDLNNLNFISDIKEINKDVQEMQINLNKRIDLINTDIERLTNNIQNKFDYMNIAINNISKKTNETEQNKNIINLLKKKLDTEKFDIYIKKIKNNLENNFLEISKNTDEKIKVLIEDNLKNINKNFSEILEKENIIINNYINENKNELSEYQIRVQGIINKMDDENKIELKKLKEEFIEKLDEKLITEKFYNLSEETKNKNNINQISIDKKPINKNNNNNTNSFLNSNEKENDIIDYNAQTTDIERDKEKYKDTENKTEKNEIKQIYSIIEEIQNELKNNKIEFSNAMDSQAIINETLCNENKIGKWIWNEGKLKNNYNIIWDTQKINTFPDNCKLENDKSVIVINEEGYYEIIFGFYGSIKKPNIQLLVDNEVVISNASKNINSNSANQICSNTIYSGFMKTNRNNFSNGNFRNVTGLTVIDFIFLKNNSKLCSFYNGDIGKGFLCLKKL